MKLNEIQLSQELIKIKSYSGYNPEVLEFLGSSLKSLGFECHFMDFDGNGSYKVNNLHAIYNPSKSKNILYFAGHTDVVKEGNIKDWTHDPFAARIVDDKLFGRGASDMKCGVACFVVAVDEFLQKNKNPDFGIGFLITNDEEAEGKNGTKQVLKWMQENGYKIPYCLVGEPTNPEKFGEMIKIGRRGSVNFELKIIGKQGHVAYPHNAKNPITTLTDILKIIKDHKFDEGNEFFDATNLEVVSISSDDLGDNVIPGFAEAKFNVRFNDTYSSKQIIEIIDYACQKSSGGGSEFGAQYELKYRVSGESFLSKPDKLASIVCNAVEKISGQKPELSTSGGTSDARFIKDYGEIVEIGLVNKTAHKVDEYSNVKEITMLKNCYLEILNQFNK